MASSVDAIGPDDLLLTAYLDGELAAAERSSLESRIASEPQLKARLETLAATTRQLRPAYDTLLTLAPTDRLLTILDRASARHAPRPWRRALLALAAAIVIFVAGGIAGRMLPTTEVHDELDWREAVAEYQRFMTTDTLAAVAEQPDALATELRTVSGKLAVDLNADTLALQGATLKRVNLYGYRGEPLVQLAYQTPDEGPVAFCIMPSAAADAKTAFETRLGYNVVYWNDDGRAYMLIGGASRATLERFAATLSAKV
jgi:anti-sigma factor RsiW